MPVLIAPALTLWVTVWFQFWPHLVSSRLDWKVLGLGNPHPPTVSQTVNSARALEAVSVLVLRHISPLVHRSALASRASTSSDNQGPRISGQALTVIILCSTIASCVLVGCLLQLPTVLISLRNRYFRSGRTATPTPTPSSSNNMPGLFDVEMSDQDLAESLNCSPPPPYSRAPSYESSGNNNISTGGRSGGEYTS